MDCLLLSVDGKDRSGFRFSKAAYFSCCPISVSVIGGNDCLQRLYLIPHNGGGFEVEECDPYINLFNSFNVKFNCFKILCKVPFRRVLWFGTIMVSLPPLSLTNFM